MDPITFRRWRDLTYHDPAEKLREYVATLREVEAAIAGQEVEPDAVDVFALRTNELNRFRDLRDGALFAYGMGLVFGMKIGIAADEDVDHDCITAWVEGDTPTYCPVQLKELPPEDRNPDLTIEGLLRDLPKRYAPTKTALVVRLSRAGHVMLDRDWPAVPFGGLWFLWASAPGAAEWSIYGDALGPAPRQWSFDYPE